MMETATDKFLCETKSDKPSSVLVCFLSARDGKVTVN